MEWQNLAKILMFFGVLLLGLGAILYILSRFGFHGLWGDIVVKRENFTFWFPLGTCIVISLLLTIIANLFFRR